MKRRPFGAAERLPSKRDRAYYKRDGGRIFAQGTFATKSDGGAFTPFSHWPSSTRPWRLLPQGTRLVMQLQSGASSDGERSFSCDALTPTSPGAASDPAQLGDAPRSHPTGAKGTQERCRQAPGRRPFANDALVEAHLERYVGPEPTAWLSGTKERTAHAAP